MNCKKYSNLLDDLVEKRLDEQMSEETLSHLLCCQRCETEVETRFDEKEIYADFLCDVNPLSDLSEQFRRRLKLENQKQVLLPSTRSSWNERLRDVFYFLSLKSALASLAIVMISGLVAWQSMKATKDEERKTVAQLTRPEIFPPENTNGQIPEQDSLPIGKNQSSILTKSTNRVLRASSTKTAEERPISLEAATALIKKPVPRNQIQQAVDVPKTATEDTMQFIAIKTFMTETERQMEKVEMLFRSFRNARINEGNNYFNVAYESQSARKLLKRSIELRKFAESHGSHDVEETLQTTEALLGEIARLKSVSLREKVIPIKRRLSDQNIIAALQVF
ncbi:MAG: hypothetical protein WKF34_07200 [Pyrinomonadaceae bacterium]